jgi:chitodextrinase
VATPASDGSRSFTVQAAGPAGSASTTASAITDGTPPSAPANLTAAIQKKSQVKLSWTASSDAGGSGVASYRIHREGGAGPRDFTSSAASYVDAQTTSGSTYTYTVRAVDALGHVSAASNAATIAVGGSTGGGGGKGRNR